MGQRYLGSPNATPSPTAMIFCRAAEIWTRDLRSPRSMHPKPLTCANTRKPPLACRS